MKWRIKLVTALLLWFWPKDFAFLYVSADIMGNVRRRATAAVTLAKSVHNAPDQEAVFVGAAFIGEYKPEGEQ